MKLTHTITMASALLLAAGCAHEERSVRTGDSNYSSGRISEYNNQSAPAAVGGSYSADGSYSSGGGGTYANQPRGNYSGTIGADGAYTPYANGDTSTAAPPVSGYAGSAGVESDNAIVAQVRESLRQDPEIALIVPNLQISAHNGAIILNGHVQSQEQKRRIFSKVQGVTGVVAVLNQLDVMAGGPNANGANPQGSPLYPTGNTSESPRLYKNANGQDTSTNNALNPTSRPNSSSQIYHDSNPGQNAQQQNSNISTNNLNTTVRSSGQSEMFEGSRQENQANMNSSSNSVNGANNSMSPTSRQNGTTQIYQNNPGEKSQN